ncbi:MAG TPA: hypothetical protein VK843_17155, partial [Planctomycetota bacterium]|nr:hypothetical protein [Planctomycetota bacterium]
VLHADGSAADEGVLDLWRADSPADEPRWRPIHDGLREEDELEPGRYQLRARAGEMVSAAATRVELIAGQSREVTLVLGASGRLRFDVQDSHGETIAARVQVYDTDGRALLYLPETEGEAGPLAPGACRVVATDSAGRRTEAQAQVVAGETTGVLLKFE